MHVYQVLISASLFAGITQATSLFPRADNSTLKITGFDVPASCSTDCTGFSNQRDTCKAFTTASEINQCSCSDATITVYADCMSCSAFDASTQSFSVDNFNGNCTGQSGWTNISTSILDTSYSGSATSSASPSAYTGANSSQKITGFVIPSSCSTDCAGFSSQRDTCKALTTAVAINECSCSDATVTAYADCMSCSAFDASTQSLSIEYFNGNCTGQSGWTNISTSVLDTRSNGTTTDSASTSTPTGAGYREVAMSASALLVAVFAAVVVA